MPVEYRQGPIYFHSVQSNKFRSEYDRIFGKKTKPAATKPVKKTKAKQKARKDAVAQRDNT